MVVSAIQGTQAELVSLGVKTCGAFWAGNERESVTADGDSADDDRPKGQAALSRSTSLKPPALPVVP